MALGHRGICAPTRRNLLPELVSPTPAMARPESAAQTVPGVRVDRRQPHWHASRQASDGEQHLVGKVVRHEPEAAEGTVLAGSVSTPTYLVAQVLPAAR